MSKELNNWALELLGSMNSSKYARRLTDLPAKPSECAAALRYIASRNQWKIKTSTRKSMVILQLVSKTKPQPVRKPSMVDKVKAQMLIMKPRETKRFYCLKDDFDSARRAVYAAREKIGGRFSTSTSKDGVLLIIRG